MKRNCFLICLLIIASCLYAQLPTKPLSVSIIPKPSHITQNEGYFKFDHNVKITLDKSIKSNSAYFIDQINRVTSFKISESKNGEIKFIISKRIENDEGYFLNITQNGIVVEASSYSGAFNGLQTLIQLIELNNPNYAHKVYFLPKVEIQDSPQFQWRGYMIDVVRHFFSIDQLKKQIDFMATLKLNRLHLHLSDDQGFRLQMKCHPQLNSIGSWRVDYTCTDENVNAYWGRPVQQDNELANYGGYYTHEQIKDLIKYAKTRNIEILPEIDIPGHAQAFIASYPELACEKRKYTVATGAVRDNNTICPSNEHSYDFLDDVISEVCDLFPLDYIHIGGDECSKLNWHDHKQCQDFMKANNLKNEHELQSYFIKRIEKIIRSKGKKMIGWDEILEGGLAENATVMSWRGEQGGISASKMGHDVIMSPSNYQYLDLKQGQSDFEPNLGYGEALLSKCYSYKVIPNELTATEAKHILGTQGNMWTESISDFGKLTYMLYPRLFAVAENAWTPYENKNWEDFIYRLKQHLNLLSNKSIRYAKSVFNPWLHHVGKDGMIKVWLTSELPSSEIRYTLDGTTPDCNSPLYKDTINIVNTTTIQTAIFENGKMLGNVIKKHFVIGKERNATIKLLSSNNVAQNSLNKLIDLTYGQLHQDGDTAWVRFDGNAKLEIDFNKPTDVNSVSIRSMRHTLISMYGVQSIVIYAKCESDKEYRKIADSGKIAENQKQGRNILENKLTVNADKVTNLRICLESINTIPKNHVNAGSQGYFVLDEIVIE